MLYTAGSGQPALDGRAAVAAGLTEESAMVAQRKATPRRGRDTFSDSRFPNGGPDDAPVWTKVWDVYDPVNHGHTGFLVTEPRNINRPIAYIDCGSGSTQQALDLAKAIAEDPGGAQYPDPDGGLIIDDLSSGIRWSWYVYGLCCLPLGSEYDGNGEFVHPRPFSLTLLSEMAEAARADGWAIGVERVTRATDARHEAKDRRGAASSPRRKTARAEKSPSESTLIPQPASEREEESRQRTGELILA